jgi:IS5 family transposase
MYIDFTETYCFVDDFCRYFEKSWKDHLLSGTKKKSRDRKGSMSLSEIVTIILGYQESKFNCFKNYYNYVFMSHISDFKSMLSYDRFIFVMQRALYVLYCLFQAIKGEVTGIQFIDSTTLETCKAIRGKRHKVFSGIAAKGKTSTGWFFGLKLHAIFNDKSEIVEIMITRGNVDDRAPVMKMAEGLWGKLFADKGYISEKLTSKLLEQGLLLITRLKKNMKNKLLLLQDKLLLYKRTIVETIFGRLKQFQKLWHSRHRSVFNAFCHLMACLISYQLSPNKPLITKPAIRVS